MTTRETKGVTALARILTSLGDGRTVAELAATEHLARSTAFDIVARLEEADFVARDALARLSPGRATVQLGFARFGLASLAGPAEAVLLWLRDESDAAPSLTVARDGRQITLVSFATAWQRRRSSSSLPAMIDLPIRNAAGEERAVLRVQCRPAASRAERTHTERVAQRARLTLEHHLNRKTSG